MMNTKTKQALVVGGTVLGIGTLLYFATRAGAGGGGGGGGGGGNLFSVGQYIQYIYNPQSAILLIQAVDTVSQQYLVKDVWDPNIPQNVGGVSYLDFASAHQYYQVVTYP
jgi:hypothetical protein